MGLANDLEWLIVISSLGPISEQEAWKMIDCPVAPNGGRILADYTNTKD